jgi:hypothetical protein
MATHMTSENSGKHSSAQPAPTTPGKPKEHGSRQQKAPDQTVQTGNPSIDRKSSDSGAEHRMPKPPNAK